MESRGDSAQARRVVVLRFLNDAKTIVPMNVGAGGNACRPYRAEQVFNGSLHLLLQHLHQSTNLTTGFSSELTTKTRHSIAAPHKPATQHK